MKSRKVNKKLKILLFLLLLITIGYALLSTTLKINGTANLKSNTWDIYWDENSINVESGSVQGTTSVENNGQDLLYNINLHQPGDYFEFTIDVVNNGTVDGMISIDDFTPVVIDENEEEIELPEYIIYELTYADGQPIEKNHKLAKKTGNTETREKYKIVIEFDKDTDILPSEAQTITIGSGVPYKQANEEAEERQKKTLETYTITFDAKGGTVSPQTKEVQENGRYGSLPTPTKEGYTFLGWYLNNTKITSKDRVTITQDETFEAQYYAHSYTITYNLNEGKNNKNNPNEYTPDDTITLQDPTKEGYTFLGWTGSNGTTPQKNVQITQGEVGNKIYTANWIEDKKIIFDATGGEFTNNESEREIIYQYDTSTSTYIGHVPYEAPTKLAGRFLGWNTEIDGSGTNYTTDIDVIADIDNINNNTKLYAKWEELTAQFSNGTIVNAKMKNLAGTATNASDTNILAFQRSTIKPNINSMTTDNIVSATNSELPIYMWFDNGTIYWWCESQNAYLSVNSESMFANLENITSLDVSNLDTSRVKYIEGMFKSCKKLVSLDLSNFNTSNVTSMSYMFYGCGSLESVNLSSFNTTQVASLLMMFYGCYSLKTLDLSSFNTSNVTSMSYMFYGCSKLKNLDLSNFNTSNTIGIVDMFEECRELESVNLSTWNTSKVDSMSGLFESCYKLKNLDLSNFNTSKVKSMSSMFRGCKSLENLDISSFDTSNVKYMDNMFNGCSKLTELDLSHFTTTSLTAMGYMFYGCSELTDLDISSFNTSKVESMYATFFSCKKITTLDLSNFDTSSVIYMDYMFKGCEELTNLDVSSFNTSNVTGMAEIFRLCKKLTYLDLSNFDISKVKGFAGTFEACSSLKVIDISNWNFASTTSTDSLFSYLPATENIIMNNVNTSNITSMRSMFSGSKKLKSLDLSSFDTSNVTDMRYMFNDCEELTNINLSSFNTSNVTSMNRMFYWCYKLKSLDLSSWDTSNVTDTQEMFSYNFELTTIYASSSFVTTNITSSTKMFDQVNRIVGGNGTVYDYNYKDATYARIDTASTPGYFTDITNKYRISFETNGGVADEYLRIINANDPIGTLPTPTREGYTFDGWYTGLTDGTQITSSYVPTVNQKVYAHWSNQ